MADESKPLRNPVPVPSKAPAITTNPQAIAEAVAREHKAADDSLAHRLALDVLGDPGDPLKNKIDSIIPERVKLGGAMDINPATPVRRR